MLIGLIGLLLGGLATLAMPALALDNNVGDDVQTLLKDSSGGISTKVLAPTELPPNLQVGVFLGIMDEKNLSGAATFTITRTGTGEIGMFRVRQRLWRGCGGGSPLFAGTRADGTPFLETEERPWGCQRVLEYRDGEWVLVKGPYDRGPVTIRKIGDTR